MLILTTAAGVLALLLRIDASGGVGIGGLNLPPLCGSRAIFDVECPACGLTRSFVLLAHGRWAEAWAVHRVAWVVALALLVQIPYRILALARRQPLPLGRWLPAAFGWSVIALLIGNWLLRQCGI